MRRPRAADQGLHADDQFAHGEGLAQVVVAARLEAAHHVFGRRPGRKEENGDVGRAAAQGIDERKAVHAGHHDVGHDDVGTRLVETAQSLDAVVGHRHVELLLAERVGDDVGERPLVLDKQHAYPIVHRREVSV